MISADSRNITGSARIGSTASSDCSVLVRVMGLPSSQLARSVEYLSARNLQTLSIITGFDHFQRIYHLVDGFDFGLVMFSVTKIYLPKYRFMLFGKQLRVLM